MVIMSNAFSFLNFSCTFFNFQRVFYCFHFCLYGEQLSAHGTAAIGASFQKERRLHCGSGLSVAGASPASPVVLPGGVLPSVAGMERATRDTEQ